MRKERWKTKRIKGINFKILMGVSESTPHKKLHQALLSHYAPLTVQYVL